MIQDDQPPEAGGQAPQKQGQGGQEEMMPPETETSGAMSEGAGIPMPELPQMP